MINNKAEKSKSTEHAYRIVRSEITTQVSGIKKHIANAKSKGLNSNSPHTGERLQGFVNYVHYYYKKKTRKPEYGQQYIIYGKRLYVFSLKRQKLVTVIEIPSAFDEELERIAKIKNWNTNTKKDYDAPLSKSYEVPKHGKSGKNKKKKNKEERKREK